MQSIPRCTRHNCRQILAILPGSWEVVRAIRDDERVGEGSGMLTCHIERDAAGRVRRGCGTRYEIRAVVEEQRRAA